MSYSNFFLLLFSIFLISEKWVSDMHIWISAQYKPDMLIWSNVIISMYLIAMNRYYDTGCHSGPWDMLTWWLCHLVLIMTYTYTVHICGHHSNPRQSMGPVRALGIRMSRNPVITGLFPVARASAHSVYLSRWCVWVGIRRGGRRSTGGALQVTLLIV